MEKETRRAQSNARQHPVAPERRRKEACAANSAERSEARTRDRKYRSAYKRDKKGTNTQTNKNDRRTKITAREDRNQIDTKEAQWQEKFCPASGCN